MLPWPLGKEGGPHISTNLEGPVPVSIYKTSCWGWSPTLLVGCLLSNSPPLSFRLDGSQCSFNTVDIEQEDDKYTRTNYSFVSNSF